MENDSEIGRLVQLVRGAQIKSTGYVSGAFGF